MANKSKAARLPRFGFDRNSPLGRFWRWWSGELIELVPQWLRESAGSADNTLLVEINPQAIVLRRWTRDKLSEQGRLDLRTGDHATHGIAFQALITKLHKRDDRIALCLSDVQCLVKQIELPLAAAENLRQVLSFEMDRHTPFKADQVYFDFRVLQRDSQNNRISVKLVAAPRSAVDASLDLLMRWGLPAQAVYVSSMTVAGEDPIDLMPVERRVTKPTALRMINLGLLWLVVVLGLAAIAVPIWQKRQLTIAMLPLVESAKVQATATDALRRDWEKLSAEYNFVLDKKQAIPPVVVQLDELSRLLPDDTWVQQFDLRGKELQIQGETASTSKLISLVETAKILRDAKQQAAVTKGLTPNSERFILAAEVKPLPVSATSVAPSTPTPASAPKVAVPPPQPNAKLEPGKAATAATAAPVSLPGQPVQPAKVDAKPAPAIPAPSNAAVPMPGTPVKPAPPGSKTPDQPAGSAQPNRGAGK